MKYFIITIWGLGEWRMDAERVAIGEILRVRTAMIC